MDVYLVALSFGAVSAATLAAPAPCPAFVLCWPPEASYKVHGYEFGIDHLIWPSSFCMQHSVFLGQVSDLRFNRWTVCSINLCIFTSALAHPWGGWRSSGSTGPGPCCRSQYGEPGCGRCCSPGRCHPARRAASSPPPWRGRLASAAWDCGLTTGPAEGVQVAEEGIRRRKREEDGAVQMRGRGDVVNEEGGREKQRGWEGKEDE